MVFVKIGLFQNELIWFNDTNIFLVYTNTKNIHFPSFLAIVAAYSAAFEKACVLFNFAAMNSQVAALQSMDDEDGLKTAAKHFQVCMHFTWFVSKPTKDGGVTKQLYRSAYVNKAFSEDLFSNSFIN